MRLLFDEIKLYFLSAISMFIIREFIRLVTFSLKSRVWYELKLHHAISDLESKAAASLSGQPPLQSSRKRFKHDVCSALLPPEPFFFCT
jgi:hypothetical protein